MWSQKQARHVVREPPCSTDYFNFTFMGSQKIKLFQFLAIKIMDNQKFREGSQILQPGCPWDKTATIFFLTWTLQLTIKLMKKICITMP